MGMASKIVTLNTFTVLLHDLVYQAISYSSKSGSTIVFFFVFFFKASTSKSRCTNEPVSVLNFQKDGGWSWRIPDESSRKLCSLCRCSRGERTPRRSAIPRLQGTLLRKLEMIHEDTQIKPPKITELINDLVPSYWTISKEILGYSSYHRREIWEKFIDKI